MSAADDGSKDRIAEFTDFRKRMNERILGEPNQVVRRFFALDTQTYQAGALDVKTKELLGLVASMVLRSSSFSKRRFTTVATSTPSPSLLVFSAHCRMTAWLTQYPKWLSSIHKSLGIKTCRVLAS